MKFFSPLTEIRRTANRLPHWEQGGSVYFVTFRLADSVPTSLREAWQEERAKWLVFHPAPWSAKVEAEYHRRFTAQLDRWLDAGHGSCILRIQRCAALVEAALTHFDGERYFLLASVIMPNHVHVLFVQNPKHSLESVLRTWKTFTARGLNRVTGRTGTVWQRDYFDRLVRDQAHFSRCLLYIRNNPVKARLPGKAYRLYESRMVAESE